jgi:hypothetical protein
MRGYPSFSETGNKLALYLWFYGSTCNGFEGEYILYVQSHSFQSASSVPVGNKISFNRFELQLGAFKVLGVLCMYLPATTTSK